MHDRSLAGASVAGSGVASDTSSQELSRGDLPELYRTADDLALRNQRLHFLLAGAELTLLALAVVAQAITHRFGPAIADLLQLRLGEVRVLGIAVDPGTARAAIGAAIVPAALIVLVSVIFVVRLILRLDERWRGQRVIAEAAKGLAWRYSMNALPGDLPTARSDEPRGEQAFIQELGSLVTVAGSLSVATPQGENAQISARMRTLRAADPQAQRAAYFNGRLNNQIQFYARRTDQFRGRRNRLRWAIGIAYVLGGPLFAILGSIGVATTSAGALGSWLAEKHYEELRQSYGGMVRRLQSLVDYGTSLDLTSADGAEQWSAFVDDVETLLEGEHQNWLLRVARTTR